jgi:hypothetical protein
VSKKSHRRRAEHGRRPVASATIGRRRAVCLDPRHSEFEKRAVDQIADVVGLVGAFVLLECGCQFEAEAAFLP